MHTNQQYKAIDDALLVLEIKKECSFEEITKSWKELLLVWHPDRFLQNKEMHLRAEEKTKLINASYQALKSNKENLAEYYEAKRSRCKKPTNEEKNNRNDEFIVYKFKDIEIKISKILIISYSVTLQYAEICASTIAKFIDYAKTHSFVNIIDYLEHGQTFCIDPIYEFIETFYDNLLPFSKENGEDFFSLYSPYSLKQKCHELSFGLRKELCDLAYFFFQQLPRIECKTSRFSTYEALLQFIFQQYNDKISKYSNNLIDIVFKDINSRGIRLLSPKSLEETIEHSISCLDQSKKSSGDDALFLLSEAISLYPFSKDYHDFFLMELYLKYKEFSSIESYCEFASYFCPKFTEDNKFIEKIFSIARKDFTRDLSRLLLEHIEKITLKEIATSLISKYNSYFYSPLIKHKVLPENCIAESIAIAVSAKIQSLEMFQEFLTFADNIEHALSIVGTTEFLSKYYTKKNIDDNDAKILTLLNIFFHSFLKNRLVLTTKFQSPLKLMLYFLEKKDLTFQQLFNSMNNFIFESDPLLFKDFYNIFSTNWAYLESKQPISFFVKNYIKENFAYFKYLIQYFLNSLISPDEDKIGLFVQSIIQTYKINKRILERIIIIAFGIFFSNKHRNFLDRYFEKYNFVYAQLSAEGLFLSYAVKESSIIFKINKHQIPLDSIDAQKQFYQNALKYAKNPNKNIQLIFCFSFFILGLFTLFVSFNNINNPPQQNNKMLTKSHVKPKDTVQTNAQNASLDVSTKITTEPVTTGILEFYKAQKNSGDFDYYYIKNGDQDGLILLFCDENKIDCPMAIKAKKSLSKSIRVRGKLLHYVIGGEEFDAIKVEDFIREPKLITISGKVNNYHIPGMGFIAFNRPNNRYGELILSYGSQNKKVLECLESAIESHKSVRITGLITTDPSVPPEFIDDYNLSCKVIN